MVNTSRTAIATLLLAATFIAPEAGPAQAAPASKLLWSQEFNAKAGTAPDPKIFKYDLGEGGGWGNSEQQYYTNKKQNIRLDGKGNLVITARRIPDPLYFDPCISCQFTSARINTADRVGFRYGRMVIRAKLPAGVGTWPALWMLGADLGKTHPWPDSGEIDIMEAKGSQPTYAYGTVHGPGYSGGNAVGGVYSSPLELNSGFHVYSIDWLPNRIDFIVDGTPYFQVTPDAIGPNKYVFNKEFFLIMNLAMGGNFTGDIDPELQQADLAIDYIRYYSLNGQGRVFKH